MSSTGFSGIPVMLPLLSWVVHEFVFLVRIYLLSCSLKMCAFFSVRVFCLSQKYSKYVMHITNDRAFGLSFEGFSGVGGKAEIETQECPV